jgi:2-oxoglutarate ferredoxin oxidoreductase subunit gamma
VVQPGGIVLINLSLIAIDSGRHDVDELKVPAVDIAGALGNGMAANIVALSAFAARSKVVSIPALQRAIEEEFQKKPKLIQVNLEAMAAGIKAAEEKENP